MIEFNAHDELLSVVKMLEQLDTTALNNIEENGAVLCKAGEKLMDIQNKLDLQVTKKIDLQTECI